MKDPDHTVDVALPGGDIVAVTRSEAPWWRQGNASGYVPPKLLAPDPKNPRKGMRAARLRELEESVASFGVRQQIIVTPRSKAPWAPVAREHEGCPFIIVSGHRRHHSAMTANLPAVPVKIVIYKDEKVHRMEMSLLNKGQDDLTPLDEGCEIVSLRELGWTLDQLGDAFGYQSPQLYTRIHLTRLHPDLQALLDEETAKERYLPVTLAGALGGIKVPTAEELENVYDNLAQDAVEDEYPMIIDFDHTTEDERRFALQKLLLSVSRARGMGATRAIQFVKEHSLNLKAHGAAGGRRPERYQPRKRMEIIDGLVSSVEGSMAIDWTVEEWRRILANASREEVQALLDRLNGASEILGKMAHITKQILGTKKATSAEVVRLIEAGRQRQHEKA